MKHLRFFLDFYLNSSSHVALAVLSLIGVSAIQLDLAYHPNLLFFVFFATISAYNFVKYYGVAKTHHRRFAEQLKLIHWFSVISLIAMCYFALQLEWNTLLILGCLALITFFYAIPFVPIHYLRDQQKNLREISGLKIYVIALIWTLTTVLIPVIESKAEMRMDVLILCFQRFVFVIVMMLPFEIRDLKYDSLKLGTIPQRIGIKNTKIMGFLLMIVFSLLDYLKANPDDRSILSTLVISIITVLFLLFSDKNQSKYYSAFWVEGLPIAWLLLLLVFY